MQSIGRSWQFSVICLEVINWLNTTALLDAEAQIEGDD